MEYDQAVSVLKGPLVPILSAVQLSQIFQENVQKINSPDKIALVFEGNTC